MATCPSLGKPLFPAISELTHPVATTANIMAMVSVKARENRVNVIKEARPRASAQTIGSPSGVILTSAN